jgi:hypothetical protein
MIWYESNIFKYFQVPFYKEYLKIVDTVDRRLIVPENVKSLGGILALR